MKIRSLAVGTLTACLAATVVSPVLADSPKHNGETILIGHRGAAGVAPENTISAIETGSRSGAGFVEIDIQLSADGVPFIFHDDTPARTSNVAEVFPNRENDPITSFTWDELQRLDVGSYFSEQFVGEKIPHFDDVADALTGETGVFIEIKSPAKSPRGRTGCGRLS
ncbi:glycerophosphodiester phosphodiesterase [Glutamicibacter ardleyensis]|uniref:glycerophosphodiester phosphodiesterase n=1 Tax=Glutamicibacter ardleyensis TaxID=225894 RepID=UPI003FD28B19